MTESIPKEHLEEWLRDPITKKVMEVLRKVRSAHQEAILNGQTLCLTSSEQTALQTATMLGKISGMNLILEIELGD